MNVAKKSTTKLPVNWQQMQKLPPKEEEGDSGVASADSTDSFHDALLNLKALSGGSDSAGFSEVKDNMAEDVHSSVVTSPSKTNGEERDILAQIDDIVNDKCDTDSKGISGSSTNNLVKSDVGSEEEDDILIISEDDKNKNGKDTASTVTQKAAVESISKTVPVAVPKNPVKIGEKVRSTVHNIMSKLVQNNPDMSSLLQKTKPEDHVTSEVSGTASLVTVRQQKGNLFDNFDIADRDSKSPCANHAPTDSCSPHRTDSTTDSKETDEKLDNTRNTNGQKSKDEEDRCSATVNSNGKLSTGGQASRSSAGGTIDAVENLKDRDSAVGIDVKSMSNGDSNPSEKSSSKVEDSCVTEGAGVVSVPKEEEEMCTDTVKSAGSEEDTSALNKSSCSSETNKQKDSRPGVELEASPTNKVNNGVDSETIAKDTEPMEATESGSCDRLTQSPKGPAEDSDSVKNKSLSEDKRKRQHESDVTSVPGTEEDDGSNDSSQPPKRSRLDEMIGKLGERVPLLSDAPENDSFDYEDSPPGDDESPPGDDESPPGDDESPPGDVKSPPGDAKSPPGDDESPPGDAESPSGDAESPSGDAESPSGDADLPPGDADSPPGISDSAEKLSEEIAVTSVNASDEEEEKVSTPSSKTSPDSNALILTKEALEALVVTATRAAVERYQSSEILSLNRRVEEMKEAKEEWRKKAKDLERQVLDLTVLQTRLEKRKAHTAALKSITTRSIGVGVTEDKLKTNTPQKFQGNRTPPATPPATSVPTLMWTNAPGRVPVSSTAGASPSPVLQSIPARNTSVAHLLSQTARMPTVASCTSATRATPPKVNNSTIRLPVNMTTMPVNQMPTTATKGLTSAAMPTTSLVFVNSGPGGPVGSKGTPSQLVPLMASNAPPQFKVIDLTAEDDAGGPKSNKQVLTSGPVRSMVQQQVVRQIPPMSQGVPGMPSSAIYLTNTTGAQMVNTANLGRQGIVQMVTFPNPGNLKPGSLVTMVPGQSPGAMVRGPATTLTTMAREGAPRLMTQPMSGSGLPVRPPAGSFVRPSGTSPSLAPGARMPVTLATLTQGSPNAPAAGVTRVTTHPAPLPPGVCPRGLPADAKFPPPRPGLKISRVKQGIVLSWNMSVPTDCVEIASYQLFAYQETNNTTPQTSLWKKVGDVKALPLPMACTLTQFQDGNKYHFAVRAIDVYGRSGYFSEPSFIYLTKAA